jgi:hypothetical protein
MLTLVAERDRERAGHAAILDALADADLLDSARPGGWSSI